MENQKGETGETEKPQIEAKSTQSPESTESRELAESRFEKTAEVLRRSVERAEEAIRWLQVERWAAQSQNAELRQELLRANRPLRPQLEPSVLPMAVAEHPMEAASTEEACVETPMTVATPLEMEGAGASEAESGGVEEAEKTGRREEGEIAPKKRMAEEIVENRKNARVENDGHGIMSMSLAKLRCRYGLKKWFPTQVRQWVSQFKTMVDEGKSPQQIFSEFCEQWGSKRGFICRHHVTTEQMEELLRIQTEDDFLLMMKENSK